MDSLPRLEPNRTDHQIRRKSHRTGRCTRFLQSHQKKHRQRTSGFFVAQQEPFLSPTTNRTWKRHNRHRLTNGPINSLHESDPHVSRVQFSTSSEAIDEEILWFKTSTAAHDRPLNADAAEQLIFKALQISSEVASTPHHTAPRLLFFLYISLLPSRRTTKSATAAASHFFFLPPTTRAPAAADSSRPRRGRRRWAGSICR